MTSSKLQTLGLIRTLRGLRYTVSVGLLLLGCSTGPASTMPAPPSQSPLPTAAPTPTPVPPSPEGTAAAFLTAWQEGDYMTMYARLSESSRTAVSEEEFVERYQGAVSAAGVITVATNLMSALRQDEQAKVSFHLELETALAGTLVTDTVMSLSLHGREWGVTWDEGLIWPQLAKDNYFRMEYAIPVRANIYDRAGLGLAVEGVIVTVGVIPGQIEDESALLDALVAVTGLSRDEIRGRYAAAPGDWKIPIADIPADASVDQNDLLSSIAGIYRDEKDGRYYPYGEAAPHVVGWVSLVPAEQLEAYRALGYRGDERVGISGLEAWGEDILSGEHGGKLSVVDSTGAAVTTLAEWPVAPGRAIHLTLDRGFQRLVQQVVGGRKGAAAVLDVNSGAVLALVSGPGFDPNVFIGPAGDVGRSQILADPRRPLFNRATQGSYPAASVFKIITLAAGLEDALMHPEGTTFFCPGYWDGLGPAARKACWKADGHGQISVKDGLTASCDVVYYSVGQALDGVGPEVLPRFARGFGFGEETGIEGVVEDSGLVPDPEWKQNVYNDAWRVGDTVNLSIGQGFLLVTPLQVARMMAAVANGGTLYRTYVIDHIGPSEDEPAGQVTQPEAVGELPLDSRHLAAIQEALLGVTTKDIGTAPHRYAGLSIPVAGKTGTAEVPPADSQPHSWFAAYAPADDPEIAIAVIVENVGEGSTFAAPMVRQIVEAYYGLPLTPLPPQAEEGYVPPTPEPEP